MVELGAYLDHRGEASEQVATHAEFGDAWADISNRLVSLGSRAIGIDQTHAV